MSIRVTKKTSGLVPFSKFSFKKLKAVIEKISKDIVLEARAQHRFTARTGNLERSVKNQITKEAKKIISTFVLDNRIANYGKFIHDGFRSWKPDPFLENSFNKHISVLKRYLKIKMKAMV